MDDRKPSDRKFETLFDGDEIEGKFYKLGDGVTGLDAPTAEFLVRSGRIAEIEDDAYAERPNVKGKGKAAKAEKETAETDAQRADREAREAEEKADAERLATAKGDFEAGRIPDDLIDADKAADAEDRLIARDGLAKLATDAKATFKGNASKADIAVAIMAARAKAEAAGG